MKSYLIGAAIRAINPSAKFTVHGDNTDTIDWLKGTTPISESDIKNKNLVEILPEYTETTQLSIVSLPVKYQLKRIGSLIKYIKQNFNEKYSELLT